MRTQWTIALALVVISNAPACGSPPKDAPLPGERIDRRGPYDQTSKRIDSRLPTRLETRVTRRTIEAPLATTTSRITADANNGCTRSVEAGATQRCRAPN